MLRNNNTNERRKQMKETIVTTLIIGLGILSIAVCSIGCAWILLSNTI